MLETLKHHAATKFCHQTFSRLTKHPKKHENQIETLEARDRILPPPILVYHDWCRC